MRLLRSTRVSVSIDLGNPTAIARYQPEIEDGLPMENYIASAIEGKGIIRFLIACAWGRLGQELGASGSAECGAEALCVFASLRGSDQTGGSMKAVGQEEARGGRIVSRRGLVGQIQSRGQLAPERQDDNEHQDQDDNG